MDTHLGPPNRTGSGHGTPPPQRTPDDTHDRTPPLSRHSPHPPRQPEAPPHPRPPHPPACSVEGLVCSLMRARVQSGDVTSGNVTCMGYTTAIKEPTWPPAAPAKTSPPFETCYSPIPVPSSGKGSHLTHPATNPSAGWPSGAHPLRRPHAGSAVSPTGHPYFHPLSSPASHPGQGFPG